MNTDCTDITEEESVLIRVIRVQKKSNYPSATKTKKNVKITPILLKHLKSSKITKTHSRATTNCSLSLYKAIFGCCPLVVRFKSGQQADIKRTTSGQQPVLVGASCGENAAIPAILTVVVRLAALRQPFMTFFCIF